ncbi:MAG: hypothetical protein HKN93_01275, partial [Acidimicrobiia bacterium]|nr:hypothetical protein [Acidimicrobiia bacterium]
MKRTGILKNLAVAIGLGLGLSAASATAQATINVGGAGTIADSTLTSGGVPAAGDTWKTEGGAAGGGNTADSFLISPDVAAGAAGSVTLTFTHRYFIEDKWDGGAIFVSVNGAPATYVPSTDIISGTTYDDTTGSNPGTAWTGGEEVFTGKSSSYDSTVSNLDTTVVDLGTFGATDTVSVEFRYSADEGFSEAGTDWEIGTVTLTNAGATDILDADFFVDGSSGFTVESNGSVDTAAWTYLKPINRFEIDADLLTSDRYTPATTGSVIDLNGANITVALLTGTLTAGDSFSLFDLSGGTTLTGDVDTLLLPGPATWSTTMLGVDGTITVVSIPTPASQLGVLDLAANGGINPNTNAPWAIGDQYRIAFVTNGTTQTTSNDPQFYRDFVTAQAWATPALQGSYWTPMMVINLDSSLIEAESPKLEAREFSGTTDVSGSATAPGGGGAPVYVMNGTTCIARNNADIWNGWSNPFAGNTTLRVGSVHYSPYLDQFGNQPVGTPDTNHGADVATGCNNAGATVRAHGNSADANGTDASRGSSNANNSGRVWNRFGTSTTTFNRLYTISYPLTVYDLSDTTAPNFVSIVDDRGGADAILGLDTIVYTVSLDEAIDISTISTSDFGTTGSASATIDSVRPTFDPGAFDVAVTPTSTGTVVLDILAGADIRDLNGNALDTSSAISDDTTITVVLDTFPPTLASIEDNYFGGPIYENVSTVTYTVTFDDPAGIDAGTVSDLDFDNAGTATATVGAVTAVSSTVFTVELLPTTTGTLRLRIPTGAVIDDTFGNTLVVPVQDDTEITINAGNFPPFTITGTAGGNNSWNTAANWDSNIVPFNEAPAIIADGVTAQVNDTQTPTYSGGLTIGAGSLLDVYSGAGSRNAIGTGPVTFNAGATLRLRSGGDPVTIPGDVTLAGDALITNSSNATDNEIRTLSGDISGTGLLTVGVRRGNTLNLTGTNTWSGGFVFNYIDSNFNNGSRVQPGDSGLGTGNVTINDGLQLWIQSSLSDTIDDSASLFLNGRGRANSNNNNKLRMDSSETVNELWVDNTTGDGTASVQLAAGDYTATTSPDGGGAILDSAGLPLIAGSGTLTVLTGPGGPATPYSLWATTNGLTEGVNDGQGQDADSGSLNNLGEFGLGGDPLDGNDDGSLLHAFSDEVVGGGPEEGILTILVRSGT